MFIYEITHQNNLIYGPTSKHSIFTKKKPFFVMEAKNIVNDGKPYKKYEKLFYGKFKSKNRKNFKSIIFNLLFRVLK